MDAKLVCQTVGVAPSNIDVKVFHLLSDTFFKKNTSVSNFKLF
jgi:hypothetical protein